jgi:hypothetical protein
MCGKVISVLMLVETMFVTITLVKRSLLRLVEKVKIVLTSLVHIAIEA